MNAKDMVSQLQTLDTQNPGSWPLWVRIAAVVLLALVLLGAGIWFLIKPVYDQVGIEAQTEIGLRNEFEAKQKKVAALDAYKAQLAEMEKSFGAMLKQLPSKSEVPNLLNDIAQTRVSASLEEELFKPTGEVRKEFYAEIPNQIVVLGSYHEMGTFVSGIAALPRIVTIDDVDIKPAAKGTKLGKPVSGLLRMQAYAKTYRYLDADEVVKAKAPGGKKGKGAKKDKAPAGGAK